MNTGHRRDVSQAAELLSTYLPEKDGRSSGERLQAIAGKALTDGVARIEARLHRSLLAEEREDARSTLVYEGLRCGPIFDRTLDKGEGRFPMDVRFGHFAYMRMRLRLIDWERKTFGDRRYGRTRHPQLVELDDEFDAAVGLALEDVQASKAQVEAWVRRSRFDGKNLSTWIVDALDAASSGFGTSTNQSRVSE